MLDVKSVAVQNFYCKQTYLDSLAPGYTKASQLCTAFHSLVLMQELGSYQHSESHPKWCCANRFLAESGDLWQYCQLGLSCGLCL